MGAREKIEKAIKNKQDEVDIYKRKIEHTRIYIEALQESLKLLPRENKNKSSKIGFRSGSMCHITFELLKETGRPMHIREILKAMGKEYDNNARASLRGSLGPYIKEGRIFELVAPATIGLLGMDYTETPIEKKEIEEEESEETTDIEPF